MSSEPPGLFPPDPEALLTAGWNPIPLPARAKKEPPPGLTGWRGRYLTKIEDRYDWTGNVALRLPPDVVGVDVDAYAGGDVGLKELEQRYGPLPPSTKSTSRSDGSGIALFRVPTGTMLHTNPAIGVQMVQCFHRYVVCAPSIHPEGRPYRWIDEQSEEVIDLPPHPGDLPDLPWAWTDGLAAHKSEAAASATPDQAREFVDANSTGDRFALLDAVIASLEGVQQGGRHDALVDRSCWLAREVAAGFYPAEVAFDRLHGWWMVVMDSDRRRRDSGEYGSAVLWAIGQVRAEPERIAAMRAKAQIPAGPVQPLSLGNATSTTSTGPPQLDPAALHGILGEVVRTIRPHTEACDAALLVTSAVQVGNYIGRCPHVLVESDRHGCALFGVLVGESARARKGTAAGRVQAVMSYVDVGNLWSNASIASGFGSGEGVIETLDNTKRSDNRLLVDEREMAALLTVASRDGSLLSSVLRNGWDGQPLRNRVKGGKLLATDYHLSALGHITKVELERLLTSTEQSNGFANRFLWVHTYRARRLPHGGALDANTLSQLGKRLATAAQDAQKIGLVGMTEAARRRWEEIYDEIADTELPGIAAALTNRAEAQTLRLALLYAVLDGKSQIDVVHLEAGWALWQYCQDSVLYIWAEATGDRDLDRLIESVRQAGVDGLSVTEAYEVVFGKHKAVGPIAARGVRFGLIRSEKQVTDGRSREVLHAV